MRALYVLLAMGWTSLAMVAGYEHNGLALPPMVLLALMNAVKAVQP